MDYKELPLKFQRGLVSEVGDVSSCYDSNKESVEISFSQAALY